MVTLQMSQQINNYNYMIITKTISILDQPYNFQSPWGARSTGICTRTSSSGQTLVRLNNPMRRNRVRPLLQLLLHGSVSRDTRVEIMFTMCAKRCLPNKWLTNAVTHSATHLMPVVTVWWHHCITAYGFSYWLTVLRQTLIIPLYRGIWLYQ